MRYDDWLTEDGLLQLENWAREGLTDKQIAEQKIGIGERTFTKWKADHKAIVAALKKGKAPVDAKVENALLKRALGYEYEETVTEVVEEEDGSKRKHVRKTKKLMPPDTTAQIFWLKNRRPDKWRDRVEQSVNVVTESTRKQVQELIDSVREQ